MPAERPNRGDPSDVGSFEGVWIRVEAAPTLSRLDVDTVVVSVGPDGFGRLAFAVRDQCPDEPWDDFELTSISPERPNVWRLRKQPPVWTTLQRIVLASIRTQRTPLSEAPSVKIIELATVSAIEAAIRDGCQSLAMPLLGTGLAGAPAAVAVGVAVEAAATTLRQNAGSLHTLVWICSDVETAEQVTLSWRNDVPDLTLSAEAGFASWSGTSFATPIVADAMAAQAQSDPVGDLSTDHGDAEPVESGGTDADAAHSIVMDALAMASLWDRDIDPDLDPSSDVTPELVCIACLQLADRTSRVEARVAQAFLDRIGNAETSDTADLLAAARRGLRAQSDDVDGPVAGEWTDAAFEFLRSTERSVRSRFGAATALGVEHLLAEALAPPSTIDGATLGFDRIDSDQLRRRLRDAVMATLPETPLRVWDEWLGLPVEPEILAGGTSEDLVDMDRGIPLSEDHLGVGNYVEMLATLVSRKDTPLPLSIGLFGEWGSGKSYFMALLREKIRDLAGLQPDTYHRDIVQISFNAWHYADANLWASLGDVIFEQLAGPKATNSERRDELKKEMTEKLQANTKLQRAADEAKAESDRLRSELVEQREERRSSLGALAGAAAETYDLAQIWRALDVSDDPARQGEIIVDEVNNAHRQWPVLRTAVSGRRGQMIAWMLLAVLVLVGAAAAVSIFEPQLREAAAALGIAGTTSVLATMCFFVARVRWAVAKLAKEASRIRTGLDKHVDVGLRGHMDALREAEVNEERILTKLERTQQQITVIEAELAELAPGNQLYGFINARLSSGEYRAQLSLISTIRRDFEQLIVLMDEWREERSKNEEKGVRPADARKPIDRIVLYIDDLDRCSPQQVVDVLQAVHLLLAMKLFVVVVGVDPRWLLHSLRGEYRGLLDSGANGRTDETMDTELDELAWQSTPQNYLEKIFNIPFVLPKPNERAFNTLVRSIAMPADRTASSTDEAAAPADDFPSLASAATGAESTPTSAEHLEADQPTPSEPASVASIPVEADSEIAQQRVARGVGVSRIDAKPLTEPELNLLSQLWRLVDTPRQTKRLLNIYRMLRSTSNLTAQAGFLGTRDVPGDFEAVILLLGILTRHPALLGSMLAAPVDQELAVRGGLCHRAADDSWAEFLDGCRPRFVRLTDEAPGLWFNDLLSELSDPRREEWDQLFDELAPALAVISPGLTLAAFQRWGPRIARFSFVLSPLAASVEATPTGLPVDDDRAAAQ